MTMESGMLHPDCPFCNLAPDTPIIYEDLQTIVIMPINPINRYQVLVIPREHYKSFIDIPDAVASHLFLLTKRLSQAVREVCLPDGVTHISDDDISGFGLNLLEHYKIHIIPRFQNDHVKIDWGRGGEPGILVRKERGGEIQAALQRVWRLPAPRCFEW